MKRLLLFLLCGVSLFAQGDGLVGVSIPITAWVLGPGCQLAQAPNGEQAIQCSNGSFSADLGISPAALQVYAGNPNYFHDGNYFLQFSVSNSLVQYPGYFYVEISYGTQELCSFDGWGTLRFSQRTALCSNPRYLVNGNSLPGGGPAQGKSDLVMTFTTNTEAPAESGWPLFINKISLTFSPQT